MGPSWGVLGPYWGHLEASWGHLGTILGPSCAELGRPGAILGRPGAVLGPSWAVLGRLGSIDFRKCHALNPTKPVALDHMPDEMYIFVGKHLLCTYALDASLECRENWHWNKLAKRMRSAAPRGGKPPPIFADQAYGGLELHDASLAKTPAKDSGMRSRHRVSAG